MSVIGPQAATLASVASSDSSTNLFAATAKALCRTVYNDSTQVLYLKFGATASSSSYTVQLPAGAYYEFPQPVYSGNVDGIWAASNGNARLTSW